MEEPIVHFAEWLEIHDRFTKPNIKLVCKKEPQKGNNKKVLYIEDRFNLSKCFLIWEAQNGDFYSDYLDVVSCPDCLSNSVFKRSKKKKVEYE